MSAQLKVGDLIATNGYGREVCLHKIERLTSTQYICGHLRFRRDNLIQFGADKRGPSRWGRVPTEHDFIEVRIAKARYKLGRVTVSADNLGIVETFLCDLITAADAKDSTP